MAVIEDVLVGGVKAGFDAVLHHLTGSGWRLELLDLATQADDLSLRTRFDTHTNPGGREVQGWYLHPEEGDTGEEVHCGFQVLQSLRAAGWEVVLQTKMNLQSAYTSAMWPCNTSPTAASDSLSRRGRASCNGLSKNSSSRQKGEVRQKENSYSVHGQVNPQRVVKLVQEFDEPLFLPGG